MPSHGDPRDPGLVTRLLREASPGSPDALARVIPLVHAELRATAARLLRREASGHTLQPTELVHEAWLRLAGNTPEDVASRQHFLAIAARLMRQILVDHARRRLAVKRGGGVVSVTLSDAGGIQALPPEEVLALDEALAQLGEQSPRLREVVEYRFFAGLEETEIAALLGVTTRTVQRDWARARAWLHQALEPNRGGTGGA